QIEHMRRQPLPIRERGLRQRERDAVVGIEAAKKHQRQRERAPGGDDEDEGIAALGERGPGGDEPLGRGRYRDRAVRQAFHTVTLPRFWKTPVRGLLGCRNYDQADRYARTRDTAVIAIGGGLGKGRDKDDRTNVKRFRPWQ